MEAGPQGTAEPRAQMGLGMEKERMAGRCSGGLQSVELASCAGREASCQ